MLYLSVLVFMLLISKDVYGQLHENSWMEENKRSPYGKFKLKEIFSKCFIFEQIFLKFAQM